MDKQLLVNNLLRENIIKATGCTEPVAVALCVAKAKEILEIEPQKVKLLLSKNVLKNAMGVGIPGTGMIGLPIAISLGIVCGESSKGLEVLNNAAEHVEKAKQWMNIHPIEIAMSHSNEKLYIECICANGDNFSKAIIAQNHLHFVHLQRNDDILFHEELKKTSESEAEEAMYFNLTVKDIFNYATQAPLAEIAWLMETIPVNEKASEEGMRGDYGLQFGKILFSDTDNSLRKRVISKTCAASDARMDGASTPVFSNSGSGNQGITCTIPIYEFGKELQKSNEEINRALLLSHLMSIYIKLHIGRLSALCGIVNASIGVGCGLVLLQGGNFDQVCYVIKNMVNTITGMICDGAKPSCALKISTGLNAAFDCSSIAMKNVVVDERDGISEYSIARTIRNLGNIGKYGMDATDDLILEIMTNKVFCQEC